MDTIQLTVRQVDARVRERALSLAKARGVSMNQVLAEALGKGLDLDQPGPCAKLLKFGGDSEFDQEFDEFLAQESTRIDEELWR